MAKKTNIEGIDENFIINSFRQDDLTLPPSARAMESPTDSEAAASEPMPPEEQREEPRRRKTRNKEQDYGALFLKEATIPARIGKTVYIRKEYHERIQLILRVIGKDEVSLFSYIDNVLAEHFAAHKEVIASLYNEYNRPIF